MVGHGGGSDSSYLAYRTSPIPSHCASIVATSTVRVNTIHMYSGITSGRVLDGELLYTKILEVRQMQTN